MLIPGETCVRDKTTPTPNGSQGVLLSASAGPLALAVGCRGQARLGHGWVASAGHLHPRMIGRRPAAHLTVRTVGHMTEQGNYKINYEPLFGALQLIDRCTRGDRAGGPSLVQPDAHRGRRRPASPGRVCRRRISVVRIRSGPTFTSAKRTWPGSRQANTSKNPANFSPFAARSRSKTAAAQPGAPASAGVRNAAPARARQRRQRNLPACLRSRCAGG